LLRFCDNDFGGRKARTKTQGLMCLAQMAMMPAMLKSVIGLLSAGCLLVGCAASPQSTGTQSAAGRQSVASTSVPSDPAQNDGSYRSVWVPPPVGSLLGGGYVRVANDVQGNDEAALLGTINQLNAAGGTKVERPYVITAVSRSTGVGERELQAQQDILQLQFGQLCAINAIARGDSNKVHEIAMLKSKGKTWTHLANANGVSIAMVVQTARNAYEMTVNSYTNGAERAKGGQQKLKSIGVIIQPNRPGN
jgi:hypothetical protein